MTPVNHEAGRTVGYMSSLLTLCFLQGFITTEKGNTVEWGRWPSFISVQVGGTGGENFECGNKRFLALGQIGLNH